jgi:phage gpG-like protein
MKTELEYDDRELREALGALARAGANPRRTLVAAGEFLVETTKQRFETGRGPDDRAWAANSPLTLDRFLGRFKGSFRKDGGLSDRGAQRAASKRPLIGESKALSTTISYRVTGELLEVGSPMEYAAVQQFGAAQGAFGRSRRNTPLPWGDIPARPFLGLSSTDRRGLLRIFNDELSAQLG